MVGQVYKTEWPFITSKDNTSTKVTCRQPNLTHNIIAMDETSVWFNMISNTTVARTSERSIQVKSTGHEKAHATVVLAAKADGSKLKPFVVFKNPCVK